MFFLMKIQNKLAKHAVNDFILNYNLIKKGFHFLRNISNN